MRSSNGQFTSPFTSCAVYSLFTQHPFTSNSNRSNVFICDILLKFWLVTDRLPSKIELFVVSFICKMNKVKGQSWINFTRCGQQGFCIVFTALDKLVISIEILSNQMYNKLNVRLSYSLKRRSSLLLHFIIIRSVSGSTISPTSSVNLFEV